MASLVFRREHLDANQAYAELGANLKAKDRMVCSGACHGVLLNANSTADNPRWGTRGAISKLAGTNIYFHDQCMIGQTWQQKFIGGLRATGEGAWTWIERHPYITLTAVAALTASIGYMHASAETY